MPDTDALGSDAKELVDLVVGYAKQETVDPLKKLGKTIAFGIVGAVMVGLGLVFAVLGGMRALQNETDAFDDNLTFLPYVFATVALALCALAGWKALGPGASGREGSR
ncbi:MAG: phage holin family protein [Acidimicrobiia bacterium]